MRTRRNTSEYAKQLDELERSINADPGRAQRALRAFKKRAAQAGEPEAVTLYADLLIGRCMQRRGKTGEALNAINQAVQKLDAMGAGREAATGYHYLSQIHSGRHDMQTALECCLRGQEIARRARDWYLQMNLVIDMAPVHRSLGDMTAAIVSYERGLEIFNKHVKGKDKRIVGLEEYTEFIILLNLAIQCFNAKRLEEAKRYLDLVAGRETKILGGAYVDMYNSEYGRVCFGLNLVKEGTEHADRVIERLVNSAPLSLHGTSNNFLGLTDDLIKCGELERARTILDIVAPIIDKENNARAQALLSMVQANYYRKSGDKDKALEQYANYTAYSEMAEALNAEDNRQSVMRRMELQSAVMKWREADAARVRQLDAIRQQMAYKAEREEILLNISENTDTFFLLYNPASRSVDFVSKNSRRLFGFDAGEAGDPVERVFDWLGARDEHAIKFISGELDARVSADFNTINYETGAPMTIHKELIPLKGRPYIMVLTDVTRVMQTQSSLITAIEAARKASQAKTSFLSNMSHDIRTPLNVIIGLLDLLEADINDEANALRHIGNMRSSANHLLGLINDMLDMSRIEAGKLELAEEEFTMPDFLNSVMSIMLPQANVRGQTLTINAHDIDSQALIGDPLHLRQAFINILGNAVKFTPPGGVVTLDARKTREGVNDTAYEFVFSDTGCGMPKEFMDRLFKPFERAETETRTIEGSGLGMAITKSIVDMMNGAIDVKSELGVGTVFTLALTLKRLRAAGAVTRDAPKYAPPERALKGNVLLVEDNPLNMEIASFAVKRLGLNVLTATNGREAVDKFKASAPGDITLILMDVRMPVMNGYDATRLIRTLGRPDAASVPVIAMTADAFEEDVRKALASGMNAHIAKPINGAQVAEILARFIPNE